MAVDLSWWFPTTLFKSVRSSSHEQSVPTCMNKPVNNHVQAGQLNHVEACQQPCSSWPCILPFSFDLKQEEPKHNSLIQTFFYQLSVTYPSFVCSRFNLTMFILLGPAIKSRFRVATFYTASKARISSLVHRWLTRHVFTLTCILRGGGVLPFMCSLRDLLPTRKNKNVYLVYISMNTL